MQYKKAAIWMIMSVLCIILIILGYYAYEWVTYQETVFAGGDETGNNAANLIYSGIAAEKGDWIYYRNSQDQGKLYKIKKDGSENTRIVDDCPYNINLVGDWIYYTSEYNYGRFYKIKTDGTGRTELNQDKTDYIFIKGEWIYYVSVGTDLGGMDYQLRKMRLDGSSKEDLVKANYVATKFASVNITEDAIFFISPLGGSNVLRTTLEGKNIEIISTDPSRYLSMVGDRLYYVNLKDAHIYSMKPDGTDKIRINQDETGTYSIKEGWIYYNNNSDEGKIYKIKIDGSEKMKVSDSKIYGFNFAGDWIYGFIDGYGTLDKVKIQ